LVACVLIASGVLRAQAPASLDAARAALASGDVAGAVSIADRLLERDPASLLAASVKIEALADAMDWESALGAYESYVNAGGGEAATLLAHVGRAYLRESATFFPSLRPGALGRLACSGDREALLQLRRSANEIRRDDVEAHLLRARLGEVDAADLLRELAMSGSPGIRSAALQALQQLRDRGAEDAVMAAFTEADPLLRLTAARTARALRLESATPQLRELQGDRHPLVAAEATAALAVLGAPEARMQLATLVQDRAADVKLAALIALTTLDAEANTGEQIEQIALDRSGSAWMLAIEELWRRDRSRATAAVRAALDDGHVNTHLQALRLARRASWEGAADLRRLRTLLRDPNPFVRLEAATVLLGPASMCES
jgi:hypothetical protein